MQTIKYSGEIEKSLISNYIPITPTNFAVISVIKAKEPKEGEVNSMIIFEFPFAIEDVENVQTGTKVLKNQIVPTFKSTVIKTPYRATVTKEKDVLKIENWLEGTVVQMLDLDTEE